MTSKEIIFKAIRLQKTPRIPVSLLSGGAWTFNRLGLSLEDALGLGVAEAADIIAETNTLVRSDIVWTGSGYHNLAIRAIGGKIKFRAKGAPDVTEPLIKEISDIEKINVNVIADDEDINILWATTRHLAEKIGDRTLLGSSQWGPFTLAGLLYGAERLMRNIYKDKEEVHKVLAFTSELCYRYVEPFIDAGSGIISIADPTASGDMISRKQFEEFALPYLKRVVEKVKARGAETFVHICGNIADRLDFFPDSGVGIISVDYKVDLNAVHELVGRRMAFAGNMNPVAIMQNATPDGVKEACIECIERAGAESSYILMPGCDVPPGVPLVNIMAMVETAWNYEHAETVIADN
jgi:uroporphyrinogen decarboxylase